MEALHAGLERRRIEGDDIAAAVLRLLPDWTVEALPVATGDREAVSARALYDAAAAELDAGHPERAAARLSGLLDSDVSRADALCGLAVVCMRTQNYDDALVLANKCIELQVTNPRALCIAGFCELKRGNRKAAQTLLARVARIARKLPEFREDMRAAQRMLLNLHFA